MKAHPKHVLAHIVNQLPRRQVERIDPAKEFKEHVRHAFSREQVTQAIKDRLVENRKREAIAAELLRIEEELLETSDNRDSRARSLQLKIQELKKRV